MFTNRRLGLGIAALCAVLGGSAMAQDAQADRVAAMKAMGGQMAVVVGMAQGKEPYDADKARAAAEQLAAIAGADWVPLFPEGSDADTLGKGKAKPEIWGDLDQFWAGKAKLAEASAALVAAAGGGLDQLRPAIGPVGAACGSCHEAYRR